MKASESSEEDVICSCCGVSIAKNAKENVWHGETPYPGDLGTGMYRSCGGDPEAEDPRGRLGFAVTCFVDARIPFVAESLSRENRNRFFAMPYEDQAAFVLRCVEKGYLL